jgi:hypothetical protein
LGISARTLRYWRQQQRAQKLTSRKRGRPTLPCGVEVRNQVIRFLHEVTGPSVGLPALRSLFPQVRCCVLRELLRKYRRVWRRRYVQRGFRLSWHHAGAVWAMDHSEPKHPVDGVYPYLLAVRDLASSRQLAWHPVKTVSADETLPVLDELIRQHGAPLVIKSDNGSAFIAQHLRGAMREQAIAQLFSPPRRPSYNGALERSNGVLKTYTHQHALAEGHPFRWTSDDLQRALELANTISRPWGHRGPTPEEAWQARDPITVEQRVEFTVAVTRHRAQACQDLGLDESEGALASSDQARRDRLALRRTLEELGYLTMQRVRRAPKKPKRPTRDELIQRAEGCQDSSSPTSRSEEQQLARWSSIVKMQANGARCGDGADHHPAPHHDMSANRERTITSWTWRFITLLISLAKTAIFRR